MRPPELVNMFAVPFGFSRHAEPGRLNPLVKQFLLLMEKSGTAANPRPFTQRNAALFESHFDLFRTADPAIQELKSFCLGSLTTLIGRLNGYDLPTLQRMQIYNDCWFHITRRGGFFGLHNHPNASWSGVYCVDPGESGQDRRESGLLCFVNPMITSAMYLDPANARMQLPYGAHVAKVRLEAGQLVLFPSWVLHDVKPYEGGGERVTIAFNSWFTLPDPPGAPG
jgi:hypothetical protein